jgi:hypothetical protein
MQQGGRDCHVAVTAKLNYTDALRRLQSLYAAESSQNPIVYSPNTGHV